MENIETEKSFAELDELIEKKIGEAYDANKSMVIFYRNMALSLAGYAISDFEGKKTGEGIDLAKQMIQHLFKLEKTIAGV